MTIPLVPIRIPLRLTAPWAALPARATEKSFGYDLSTIEPLTIAPHATIIAKTGLYLTEDLPNWEYAGLALLVLPRSSLTLKHGLIVPNAPGLIDADYTGEIGVVLHNLRDAPATLELGTRIAQAVFIECQMPTVFEVSASTPFVRRGERGGFGSTGL